MLSDRARTGHLSLLSQTPTLDLTVFQLPEVCFLIPRHHNSVGPMQKSSHREALGHNENGFHSLNWTLLHQAG